MTFSTATDFPAQVALGRIPGFSATNILGRNNNLDPGATGNSETIWDQGGDITFLTADTTLYVSSSSASDTAVTILAIGLDDNYDSITATATTNGQNQVALNVDMFRVFIVRVTSATTPIGDLYIAEADTLTAGVPNTASKIKSKIPLSGVDAGTVYASDNITHNGFFTVPNGKVLLGIFAILNSDKNHDIIEFGGRIMVAGTGPWLNSAGFPIYQSVAQFPFGNRSLLPAKSELQFRARSSSAGALAQAQIQIWLADNPIPAEISEFGGHMLGF